MRDRITKIAAILLTVLMISACALPAAADDPLPFTDVKEGTWYYKAVAGCYKAGYMNGTSETTFGPSLGLTREMFVTILAAFDKADVSGYTEPSFDDVAAGKWYTAPIGWAAENGFTAGKGDGIFGVGETVTREQVAQFLYTYAVIRGIDVSATDDLSMYYDASEIAGWALTAVKWAVGAGIISGKEGGFIDPRGTATRAEVAVMIMRFDEYVESLKPAPKMFVLTFDANGGLIDGEPSVSFGANYKDSYREITGWDKIHEPVREGYVFTGWYYMGWFKLDNLDETFSITEDGTLIAGWED